MMTQDSTWSIVLFGSFYEWLSPLFLSSFFYYVPEVYLLSRSWILFIQSNLERKLGSQEVEVRENQYSLWQVYTHGIILVETLLVTLIWHGLFWGMGMSTTLLVDLYTATFPFFFLVKAALLVIHSGLFTLFFYSRWGKGKQCFPVWVIHLWVVVTVSLMLLVGTYHLVGLFVLLELYTVGVALLFTWSGVSEKKSSDLETWFMWTMRIEQVIRYLLTNLHVTLYFLLFLYIVYQQTGSFSVLYLSLLSKYTLFLTPMSQSYLLILYALMLLYIFFKLALFPFLRLYTQLLRGVSKEVLIYYVTVPKIPLLCLAKKIFFVFCWTQGVSSWWLGILIGIGLGTLFWATLNLFRFSTISEFFIYSSFGTTGFLFIVFLLPTQLHLLVSSYLYLYLVATLTLFSLWYIIDVQWNVSIYRWDQFWEAMPGTFQHRILIASLFWSLGAFSPFSAFFIKYIFLLGWVSTLGIYAWFMIVLIISAFNGVAYFYLGYLMVRGFFMENKKRGLFVQQVSTGFLSWKRCIYTTSWVQLGLLLTVPFFCMLEWNTFLL